MISKQSFATWDLNPQPHFMLAIVRRIAIELFFSGMFRVFSTSVCKCSVNESLGTGGWGKV